MKTDVLGIRPQCKPASWVEECRPATAFMEIGRFDLSSIRFELANVSMHCIELDAGLPCEPGAAQEGAY